MSFLGWLFVFLSCLDAAADTGMLSPTAVVVSADDNIAYVACNGAGRVLIVDLAANKIITAIPTPLSPSGLVLSDDGKELVATCAGPESKVCVVDTRRRKVIATIRAGYGATAPVLSRDGDTLYVCNQFDSDVSVFDLRSRKEVRRVGVEREPVAADLSRDGRYLLVANQLPMGPANARRVAAVVSVIDVVSGAVVKEINLENGSKVLKDIRVSPDGKYAVVTHIVGSFDQATSQVDLAWINANALTIIELASMEVRYTLLLDEPRRAAGNPWGCAWSADGRVLAVAHAGTHEISVIDFPAMLAGLPAATDHSRKPTPVLSFESYGDDMDTLPYLIGERRRVALAKGDYGPRAIAVAGHKVYTADYFSDTLSAVDLDGTNAVAESIAIGPKPQMDVVRTGEFYFNDATICRQGWHSCASCHPDGRADGLNWDMLNDGVGNPKNTKSLVLSHQTPPAMWLGGTESAEKSVRGAIQYLLFTKQPESVASSIDEYLKSLKPMPSPILVHGRLSREAKRGRKVFAEAGCADCHAPGLFTDMQRHDVGTVGQFDRPTDRFDTPSLVELWRTAPYLHDGSAATVRDVLTTRNGNGKHGNVSGLSKQQLDELCAYLLSL